MDDEPLARRNLSSLLALEPDFEVIGECADARAALDIIDNRAPDLVFLDVQMPRLDGFGVLESMRPCRSPLVIFVTAYDHFAVRAFEAQALDYLLKPFRRDRFNTSLERARRSVAARRAGSGGAGIAGRSAQLMVVRCRDRHVFVRFDALEFIRAAANYVQLYVGTSTYEVRERITILEERLPPDRFLRIHRSYIVNIAAIKELCCAGAGEYLVSLRGGRQLPVGPNYTESVQRRLLHDPGAGIGR